MTDKMKFIRLYTLLAEWQIAAEKMEALLSERPSDLIVTQYIMYSSHAAQLEAILNDHV